MEALWCHIFKIQIMCKREMCAQAHVCVCLCVFEEEENEGEIERQTDQIGAGQTEEELRWRTDLIAAVM